jgi:chromosome segregation ATPase
LRAGYRIETIERTKVPLFGSNDLVPQVDERSFGADVIDEIRRDPDHDTLQFVIRAVPVADDDRLRVALDELSVVESKLVTAHGAIDRLERLLDARHRDGERLAELEAAHAEREAELARYRESAAALRERVTQLETEIGEREKYAAADAEDQRVALAEELAAVRAREEDREEAIAALRAEATELRANLIEASRSVGEAYALRAAVDQAHATLSSVHDSMQAKVREAELELAHVAAVASRAELESVALRTALDELRHDYESLGETNRKSDVDREMLAARLAEFEHLARTREAAAAEALAEMRRSLAERPVDASRAFVSGPVVEAMRPQVSAPTPAQIDTLARLDSELQIAQIAKKTTIDAFARHIDADTSMVRAEMAEIDALIRRIQNGKIWRAKAALGRLRRSFTRGRARV